MRTPSCSATALSTPSFRLPCASWLRPQRSSLRPFNKTIADAAEHYLAHLKATEQSIELAELVPQMIAAKKADGMSARYLRDLRSKLTQFKGAFGKAMVAAISAKAIDAWLRSLPVDATNRNNFRRVLVTFFSHAISLGYAVANPAAKTAKRAVSIARGLRPAFSARQLMQTDHGAD